MERHLMDEHEVEYVRKIFDDPYKYHTLQSRGFSREEIEELKWYLTTWIGKEYYEIPLWKSNKFIEGLKDINLHWAENSPVAIVSKYPSRRSRRRGRGRRRRRR